MSVVGNVMSSRGKKHARAILVVVGAAAILAGLLCYRRKEPRELTVRPVSIPLATSATSASPLWPLVCQGLPSGASAAMPLPPTAARLADYPSPRNSDGTRKRLPPPPPSEPGHTLLFRYDDFGPPSMQLGLLGDAWWSWEAGGSFEPGDEFDVRVVVHQGRRLEDIERRYPTIKGESDYRFIQRDEALRYLDAQIAELEAMPADPDEYDFGPVRRELEQVRSRIISCLPPAATPGERSPAP